MGPCMTRPQASTSSQTVIFKLANYSADSKGTKGKNEMDDFDSIFNDQPNLSAEDVRRITREETLNTLTAIQQSTAIAQQVRNAAIAEAQKKYPNFVELYSDPELGKRLVNERPTLVRMILTAEAQGSDALGELYGQFVDSARALGMADKTEGRAKESSSSNAADSKDISTSESRQALIRSFEERYGDVSVDLADDSEEGKRTRRY